jgi:hypothetical protein
MYIGPETIMPLASAIAAIGGMAMLFWRRLVNFFRVTAQTLTRTVARLVSR